MGGGMGGGVIGWSLDRQMEGRLAGLRCSFGMTHALPGPRQTPT